MLTVKFYGELRRLYGISWTLDVNSPAEAIHALCVQLNGLRNYFVDHATDHFLVRGNHDYVAEELHYPQPEGVLKIVPVVEGSGAVGRIIAGAVMAVAGGVMTFYGVPGGVQVMAMGVALALGGIAELIAPRAPGTATPEQAGNTPSLAFNGAVNTMGQGGPVPLGYGRMLVGSQVISIGFSTNNEVVIR
jgi:predicted phage tail protein